MPVRVVELDTEDVVIVSSTTTATIEIEELQENQANDASQKQQRSHSKGQGKANKQESFDNFVTQIRAFTVGLSWIWKD